MKILQITILILATLAIGNSIYTPESFSGGFFKFNDLPPQLYEVDIWEKKGDNLNGNVMMIFGDIDGNTYTDFITLHVDNNKQGFLKYYKWDTDKKNFKVEDVCKTPNGCGKGIVNAYLGDITYNGNLEILILFDQNEEGESFRNLLPLQYTSSGSYSTFNSEQLTSIRMHKDSQPFLANVKNTKENRNIQIIYEDVNLKRKVLQTGIQKQNKEEQLVNDFNLDFSDFVSDSCPQDKTIEFRRFSNPHFNAVVDINGDCMADLVLTTVDNQNDLYLEFWIYQQKDGKYCLQKQEKIDQSKLVFKAISYQDLNFDGSIDLTLLFTDKENKNTYIQSVSNSLKVDSSKMCTAGSWDYPSFNQNKKFEKLSGYSVPENDLQGITTQLRFGDINLDGFNDLLIVLQNENKNPMPYILLNKGEDDVDFSLQNGKDKYSLEAIYGDKTNMKFVSAAFFDINENGILDIYLNYIDTNTGDVNMAAVYNYLKNENYFLKTLGLNGQCQTSKKCQAALYYGTSFMCKVTVNDNRSRAGKGAQLSQSAYSPLQLPFSILGLGRTNNYIENLMAGYPQTTSPSHQVWQTIIPNSQLIIFPYGENVNHWKISIFIQPTKTVIVVIIVTATFLIFLGVGIFYCHIKEKEEDKKNSESLYQIFR